MPQEKTGYHTIPAFADIPVIRILTRSYFVNKALTFGPIFSIPTIQNPEFLVKASIDFIAFPIPAEKSPNQKRFGLLHISDHTAGDLLSGIP